MSRRWPDGTTYLCVPEPIEELPEVYGEVWLTADSVAEQPDQTPFPIPPRRYPYPPPVWKSHAEARALAPVSREENGAQVVKEQPCYLPNATGGRPLVGKVRGVENVWSGGG
jgi:hypothetical protein